jgi:hypothetical protein
VVVNSFPKLKSTVLRISDGGVNSKRAFIFLVFVFLASTAANAANLVRNPNFRVDLSHWTTLGSTVTFDNADGSPSAGSAHLSATPPFVALESDCFAVNSPQTYDLSAMGRVNVGMAALYVFYFAGNACQGDDMGGAAVSFGDQPGVWIPVALHNLSITNSTIGSGYVAVLTTSNEDADIDFDTVAFRPSDQVFADGFEE